MTPEQAAQFAIDTIKAVKMAMITNGFGEPEDVLRAIKNLHRDLQIPCETIVAIFEVV